MGLTSPYTLVAACAVLVLLTVGTLVLWRPVESAGPLRWPLRASMVISGQLIAVLVAGLALNNAYAFYASWSELLGRHGHSSEALSAAGSVDSRLAAQLAADSAAGIGTVTTIAVPGVRSHVPTLDALVYLPPQYGDPAYSGRSFPVVELLAGYPGTPRTWTTALSIKSILDSEIRSGHSTPFIAVIPNEFPTHVRDTECVNAVGGYQMATYLTFDVRSATQSAVRASTRDDQWAVMGYSTGGYCAANLAFQYPSQFHAAVSIAGYNGAAHDHTTGSLFGRDRQAQLLNNIVWREQNLPAPRVDLLLVASMQDPQSVAENQYVTHASRSPEVVYTLTVPRGGHNAATFKAELPACLGWLSRFVAGPLAPIPTVDGVAVKLVNNHRPKPRPNHQVVAAKPVSDPSGSPVR